MTLLKFLTLALFLISFSCDTTEAPPPQPPTIQLRVEDASCTEAWLKITLTDANQPRTIALSTPLASDSSQPDAACAV